MMRVFDNIFDRRYLDELVSKLSHSPWYPNNIANRSTWPYGETGSHCIFGEQFFERKSLDIINYGSNVALSHELIDCFYAITRKAEKNLVLQEIAGNLQFAGMNGSDHRDTLGGITDDIFSYILMLSADPGTGGAFVNETENKVIPFKHGRGNEIEGHAVHRGLAFETEHKPRYSVKFVGLDNLIRDNYIRFW